MIEDRESWSTMKSEATALKYSLYCVYMYMYVHVHCVYMYVHVHCVYMYVHVGYTCTS